MASTYGPDAFPIVDPTDRIKDGSAGIANVRIDINKVARKAQDNDAMIRAEAAQATQEVAEELTGFQEQTEEDLSTKVETTDPRMALIGPKDRPHAWTDPAGRTALYSDTEGVVHAPLPIEAPGVGYPSDAMLRGTYDPVTGRWAADAIQMDGLRPLETIQEELQRAGGGGGGGGGGFVIVNEPPTTSPATPTIYLVPGAAGTFTLYLGAP